MRLLPVVLLLISTPALAGKGTLTCAFTSRAGGKATVTIERSGDEAVSIVVRGDKADLTLKKSGASGRGIKVASWALNEYKATEIDFSTGQDKELAQGHVSFEKQEDIFRFEVKGAPAALRQALKLGGGWFVLAFHPGKPACQPAVVGVATLGKDGTLRMQYRSIDHGMIAEAMETVRPGDEQYKKYLEHLGGLKPGESKSIPEFPPDGERY